MNLCTIEDGFVIRNILLNQIHYFEENYSIPSRISKIKLSQISTMRLNNHELLNKLIATSRAPQIMVLSMLRSFGKIGPQIDQIWAWLSREHRWSPGVRNPLKSSVTGPSLLVNCYLEIKFHKIIRVNPPPLMFSIYCCKFIQI